jgi:hypothetical protein
MAETLWASSWVGTTSVIASAIATIGAAISW